MIEQLVAADRLLTVDLVDQAEAIYADVASRDPRNAMAVVGLARCALARGDDLEAYRLAARALEIDPQDDMARRMEARLSEILAYRGEPVTRPIAAGTETPLPLRPVVAVPVERTEPHAVTGPHAGRTPAGAGTAPTHTGTAPGGGTAPAPEGRPAPAPEGRPAPAPEGVTAPAPQGVTAPAPQADEIPALSSRWRRLLDRSRGR